MPTGGHGIVEMEYVQLTGHISTARGASHERLIHDTESVLPHSYRSHHTVLTLFNILGDDVLVEKSL